MYIGYERVHLVPIPEILEHYLIVIQTVFGVVDNTASLSYIEYCLPSFFRNPDLSNGT